MRSWFRGFFVDPVLEEKAHEFIDKANRTADRADKVVQDAEKKIRKLDPIRLIVQLVIAVVALFVGCGIAIGSQQEKLKAKTGGTEK